MTNTNKHGLARDIPEPVKRTIRQECFNGCVICGKLPYRYEHFDPPFVDATSHNPAGMALLCSTCEDDKTAGRINAETVRNARNRPFNKARDALWKAHLGSGPYTLRFGGQNDVSGPNIHIVVNSVAILGIREDENGFLLVSAFLCDPGGFGTLSCRDNEVIVRNGVWDFAMEGTLLTIRSGPKNVVARVSFDAAHKSIDFQQVHMRLGGGHRLDIDDSGFRILGPRENFSMSGTRGRGVRVASGELIRIDNAALGTPDDWMWGDASFSPFALTDTTAHCTTLFHGSIDNAIRIIRENLQRSESQNTPVLSHYYYLLSDIERLRGHLDRAIELATAAVDAADLSNDRLHKASARSLAASIHFERDYTDTRAKDLFEEAEQLHAEVSALPSAECNFRCAIQRHRYVEHLIDVNKVSEAQGLMDAQLKANVSQVSAAMFGIDFLSIAKVHSARGNPNEALKAIDVAIEWLLRARIADYLVDALLFRANLTAQTSPTNARLDLERGQQLIRLCDMNLLGTNAQMTAIRLSLASGDTAGLTAKLEDCVTKIETIGSKRLRLKAEALRREIEARKCDLASESGDMNLGSSSGS